MQKECRRQMKLKLKKATVMGEHLGVTWQTYQTNFRAEKSSILD